MKTGSKITFVELIQQHTVVVPPMQRDYVQGRRDQKSRDVSEGLICALVNAIKLNKKCHLNFVIGTRNDDDSVFLLDGQQRLTTLFLLHFYIALMSNRLNSFRDLVTDKDGGQLRFRYETRFTTQTFLDSLLNCEPSRMPNDIELFIRQSNWYVPDYDDDASISSMIDVLARFHKKFERANFESLYEQLFDRRSITFFFLLDEAIDSPHDHYIKINSRGKRLTDLELFKSSFYAALDKHNELQSISSELQEKLDDTYPEFLWQLFAGENRGPQVDRLIRSLIHTVFWTNELLSLGKDEAAERSKTSVLLYSFEYDESLLKKSCALFMHFMDSIMTVKETDDGFFDAYIKSSLIDTQADSYPSRTFLYCLAICASQEMDVFNFKKWTHFLRNVVFNDDGIDGFEDVYARCQQFASLIQFDLNTIGVERLDKFRRDLLRQELEKASWIANEEDLKAITEIEQQLPFFNGRIYFLLHLSIQGTLWNKPMLRELAESASFFGADNYADLIAFFLAKGIPALEERISASSGTYTFGYNDTRHYAHHWRSIFNNRYSDFEGHLKTLLNRKKEDIPGFIQQCREEYLRDHDEESFHRCLIEMPDLLKEYMNVSASNYGRYWRRNESDIYLLQNTQRVNYSHYLLLYLFLQIRKHLPTTKIIQNNTAYYNGAFIDSSHIELNNNGQRLSIYYCGKDEGSAAGFYGDEERQQPYHDADGNLITTAQGMMSFLELR